MDENDKSYYLDELDKLKQISDKEYSHRRAGHILCEILENLGYKDIVQKYSELEK